MAEEQEEQGFWRKTEKEIYTYIRKESRKKSKDQWISHEDIKIHRCREKEDKKKTPNGNRKKENGYKCKANDYARHRQYACYRLKEPKNNRQEQMN